MWKCIAMFIIMQCIQELVLSMDQLTLRIHFIAWSWINTNLWSNGLQQKNVSFLKKEYLEIKWRVKNIRRSCRWDICFLGIWFPKVMAAVSFHDSHFVESKDSTFVFIWIRFFFSLHLLLVVHAPLLCYRFTSGTALLLE